MKKQSQITIDPDTLILDLTETYPEAIDFLVREYELHCVGCIMAGFETLRQGAEVHGITGKDFSKLVRRLEEFLRAQSPVKH